MLDAEQWLVNESGDSAANEWNQAMNVKYNAMYDIAKSVLPGVPIHWSARGHPPGWRRFTLQERGDSFSVECYYTWDINHVRISYRSIYNEAQLHGGGVVIPWIALGSGYYPTPNGDQWNYFCDLDYGAVYSWQLGAELNLPYYAEHPDQYAHWDAAQIIAMYPCPFDTRNPRFAKHFARMSRAPTT